MSTSSQFGSPNGVLRCSMPPQECFNSQIVQGGGVLATCVTLTQSTMVRGMPLLVSYTACVSHSVQEGVSSTVRSVGLVIHGRCLVSRTLPLSPHFYVRIAIIYVRLSTMSVPPPAALLPDARDTRVVRPFDDGVHVAAQLFPAARGNNTFSQALIHRWLGPRPRPPHQAQCGRKLTLKDTFEQRSAPLGVPNGKVADVLLGFETYFNVNTITFLRPHHSRRGEEGGGRMATCVSPAF